MKIYGIYDLENKEQCMRVGDIREIAEFLNVTARRFNGIIRNGICGNRYKVLYVYEEKER